jgi:uncharacterized protein
MKLTAVITVILSFITFSLQAQLKNYIDVPYLEVNGSADTFVTPDEIFIKIHLSEKDTRDRVSIEDLELKMVNALRSLGADTDKDLTTTDISSIFKSGLFRGKDVIKSKVYVLKVRDAATASSVFVQLEELGISNTSIDRVSHSDLDNIRNQLRSKAITNAKTRAIALTKPIGQTVAHAIHIVDQETYNNQNLGRTNNYFMRGYALDDKRPRKLEFEKINVTATISAKFILAK